MGPINSLARSNFLNGHQNRESIKGSAWSREYGGREGSPAKAIDNACVLADARGSIHPVHCNSVPDESPNQIK